MHRVFGSPVEIDTRTQPITKKNDKKIEVEKPAKNIVDKISNKVLEQQNTQDANKFENKEIIDNKGKADVYFNKKNIKLQRYELVKDTKLFKKFLEKEKETERQPSPNNLHDTYERNKSNIEKNYSNGS